MNRCMPLVGDITRMLARQSRAALVVLVLLGLGATLRAQLNYQFSFDGPTGLLDYGTGFDNIGDVDGDGVDDLVLGAQNYQFLAMNYGLVEVRSGATGALIHSITSPLPADSFGCSVAGVGDVDFDSVPDFVVGAFRSDIGIPGSGRVDVYSGASGSFILSIFGPSQGALFGAKVVHMGDVDSDGTTDLAVSSPGLGAGGSIYILSGQTGAILQLIQGTAARPLDPILERVGDLDFDGKDDLVSGSPTANTASGAYIGFIEAYSSATGALLFHVDGQHYNGKFGATISRLGDVNNDGIEDLIVGASTTSQGILLPYTGRVVVLSGFDGSVIHDIMGQTRNQYFGNSVLGIDDLTGDGVADFLVGSDGGTLNGNLVDPKISLHSGKTGAEVFNLPGALNSGFGGRLKSAGDIDGDGQKDVVALVDHGYSGNFVTHSVYLTSMMTPSAIGGGQANGVDATLLMNGIATGSLAGPFSSTIMRGLWFSIDLHGAPFSFYEVYSSPTINPGGWIFPGFGSLDIGTGPTFSDVAVLFPGFASTFPLYALDATGEAHLSFYLPPTWPAGPIGGIQALIQRPQPWTGNLWGALSAAHELVLQ